MQRRVLILAHYHPLGQIRPDTCTVLERALACFDQVYLVSTGIDATEARKRLPASIKLMVRPNVGYDILSYQAGLLEIKSLPDLDEVVIMNDSIYIHDPSLFVSRCLAPQVLSTDFAALTQNVEVVLHGQSFFLIFRRGCLARKSFWDWWQQQQPLKEKHDIVLRQEIGLSHFLISRNCTFSALFRPHAFCHYALPKRSEYPTPLSPMDLERLLVENPTHFFWPELLKQFGFVKLEVLRDNPHQFDLAAEWQKCVNPASLDALLAWVRT